jgi:shikimate dehydrogenase
VGSASEPAPAEGIDPVVPLDRRRLPLRPSPDGETRLAAVIGSPVRHSLSPLLHNAGFAALDLPWVYLAFEVSPGQAAGALGAMRVLGIEGLSVTMPHKSDVAAVVDRLSPVARRLGAVNCVRRDGSDPELLVGENTDGEGFLRSLAEEAGFTPEGRRCVVLGGGGAARAVIVALSDAGAAEVGVLNRSVDRASAAASLAGPAGRVVGLDAVAGAELVVNATPVGMAGTGEASMRSPLDERSIRPDHVVVDLVYHPRRTLLLQQADARGATVVGGLGMLLHQAGLAFQLWTGRPAPIDAMRNAVLRHLDAQGDEPRAESMRCR